MERVKELDDLTAQRLLDEWDDILLQIEIENDEETLKAFEEAKSGKNLTPHEEVKRMLQG